jgi:Tol biopolymer transport system component
LDSYWPSISADGARIAFISDADDLVDNDTNGRSCTHTGFDTCGTDVFSVRRDGRYMTRVSVSSSGEEQAVASDGAGNPTSNGSPAAGVVAVSADGRYTAFASYATNLDRRSDTNAAYDVFVHDLVTGATVLASVTSTGEARSEPSLAPTISGDGSLVGFSSAASDAATGDGTGTFVHQWR